MPENRHTATAFGMDEDGNRGTDEFLTLGSDVRMKILKELLQGDRGIAELAAVVGLHPVTVRYHVNILVRDGLVEKRTQRREGEVGRPPVRFRLRHERMVGGFPPRRYQVLSEILLGIIEQSLEKEEWQRALYVAGREFGRQLIQVIERKDEVSSWSPARFVRHYLEGALAEMGLVTALADQGDDFVSYRAFTCPFQELAIKYPDKICNHLDLGFHTGVSERLGPGVIHERLACMGHGDPYCEYYVRWSRGKQ